MGNKLTSRRPKGTQSCVFCGKQLSNYTVLIEHINSHIGERPCRCAPCDLWFATGAVLCEHRRIVHEKKKVTCPFCGKQFNFSSNLSDHKRRVHFKQNQQLKRRREIQRRGAGSRFIIKKTAKPLRVVKSKTVKHSTIQEKASEKEIFLEEQKVLEESQEVGKCAEEEEMLEESEEETVYPHQINNHEEYFRAINQQRLAVLSAIFKAFQIPTFVPFRPVSIVKSVEKPAQVNKTVANNWAVSNNEVSVATPSLKNIPTATSQECTVCGKHISRRSNLLQHLRNVHGVQPTGRKYTNKLTQSRREEKGSSENKSSPPKSSGNQLKYKCYKCSSLFSHSNMLRKHMTTKHPGCPVKIKTSVGGQRRIPAKSQMTGQKEPLKDSRRERERGLFKCAKCDVQYSWRFDLIRHTRRKHPELDVSSLQIVNMAPPNISCKPSEQKLKEEVSDEKKLVKIGEEISDKVRTPRVTRRIYRSGFSKQLASKMNKIVFKCYKCSVQFPRIAAFNRHMTQKHGKCPTKILIATQNSSSTNAKNTSSMTGAFKCPECSTIFKWKKNLARHIRSVHNSVTKCGEVLENHFGEPLNPDPANVDLRNPKNSEILLKKIVKKRTILRRAPKGTGNVAKSITDDSNCSKHDKYVSRISTSDISNSTDKSPAVSASNKGGSGMFQCDNCERCFGDKWKLTRHLKLNGCLHAKRAALAKLDAFLDFICNVCKRQFKGNSNNTARYLMEYHLATVHRFHHENAREYQHFQLRHAPPIFFCTFCGLKESTKNAIVKHLRSNHRDLIGVRKKTPKKFAGTKSRCQCDKCGRWFGDKCNLTRHLNRNGCLHTKRTALAKLDACLDFICEICNQQFRGSPKNTARYLLERHLAIVHRFHHTNCEEYQHLKQSHAPPVYFCTFCGSQENTTTAMVKHLRSNHRDRIGVPKKFTGITDSPDGTDPKSSDGAFKERLQSSEVPKAFSTNTPSVVNILSPENLDTHHSSNTGEVLQEPSGKKLKMSWNSGKAEKGLGNIRNSTLSVKRIVSKRKTPRRAPKATGTGTRIKPTVADSSSCEDAAGAAALSNKSASDLIDHLPTDMSPAVSIANSGGSESCQDASLDFICPICNKEFKTNCGARRILEYHIASGHRFDHANAVEYRHLKLGKAPGIYFCAICGSREASRLGLADHLRKTHKELLGVPKKTVHVESFVCESQETDQGLI